MRRAYGTRCRGWEGGSHPLTACSPHNEMIVEEYEPNPQYLRYRAAGTELTYFNKLHRTSIKKSKRNQIQGLGHPIFSIWTLENK